MRLVDKANKIMQSEQNLSTNSVETMEAPEVVAAKPPKKKATASRITKPESAMSQSHQLDLNPKTPDPDTIEKGYFRSSLFFCCKNI
jgi:hypothetical protein